MQTHWSGRFHLKHPLEGISRTTKVLASSQGEQSEGKADGWRAADTRASDTHTTQSPGEGARKAVQEHDVGKGYVQKTRMSSQTRHGGQGQAHQDLSCNRS